MPLLVVEIGLMDMPKYGGAMVPPAPPVPTGLLSSQQKLRANSLMAVNHVEADYVSCHDHAAERATVHCAFAVADERLY